jgi:alpha-1,3-mannosyltransferase
MILPIRTSLGGQLGEVVVRIAHVCRVGWPHLGGMESAVGGLAGALAKRGHDVRVVTLDRAISDGRPLPRGDWLSVPYLRVPRWGPRRWPFARGLLDAVRGVDVIHVHGVDGLLDELVATRRGHRARIGVSTHGGYLHTERHLLLKRAWLRTGTRLTLRAVDAVWFSSAADRGAFAPSGARGAVIADGVDVEAFAGVERHPEPGRWLVLGRLDVHKGLFDLLATLRALLRVDPRPFRVDIVGPEAAPGLRARLQSAARSLGLGRRVAFHGSAQLSAIRSALARAELALFPSRYEGFGVAVVEAMAAGVPPVVSAIPAFDALVLPGTDGWRVDFRRPMDAARALASLREVDQRPVATAARRSAESYGWDRRVLIWEQAYQAVLGSP